MVVAEEATAHLGALPISGNHGDVSISNQELPSNGPRGCPKTTVRIGCASDDTVPPRTVNVNRFTHTSTA